MTTFPDSELRPTPLYDQIEYCPRPLLPPPGLPLAVAASAEAPILRSSYEVTWFNYDRSIVLVLPTPSCAVFHSLEGLAPFVAIVSVPHPPSFLRLPPILGMRSLSFSFSIFRSL